MLLTKTVKVKYNHKYKSFIDKYKADENGLYEIDVKDLPNGSTVKVLAKCDFCGSEHQLNYSMYLKNIKSCNCYSCVKCRGKKISKGRLNQSDESKKKWLENIQNCWKNKSESEIQEMVNQVKNTKKERYGNENYNNSKKGFKHTIETIDKIKKSIEERDKELSNRKMKETCLIKYKSENYSKSTNFFSETKIGSHQNWLRYIDNHEHVFLCTKCNHEFIISANVFNSRYNNNRELCTICNPIKKANPIKLTEYKKYHKKVMKISRKVRNIVFENWDGYDYYDNEYIRDFKNLDCYNEKYPTIDHKISILYGFLNDIDEEIIADIINLCVTKRKINSVKNKKCEKDFKLI